MKEPDNGSYRYQVGGALGKDVSSYVVRAADRQFYEALQEQEFCYVLNSRQMGKTSLMVRTLAQLKSEGWAGIVLDFSAKDSQAEKPDRWYNGIINQLNRHFDLLENARNWLKERDCLSPVERLEEFIETVLLPGINQSIVIFIDEIDSTLNLPFTDDFFALIRACYNKRAENPDYRRLTFALLGVATPAELIGDKKRTPFNIGKAIDLKGFDLGEAAPLIGGLVGKADSPQSVLREILNWTGGQPFLTQRLCQLLVNTQEFISAKQEAQLIDQLVRTRLIENWESQDEQEHLKTIRNRLVSNEQKAGYLLELYRQIRQTGKLKSQNTSEERDLQLSGLVVKRDDHLTVYNPIYEQVFNEQWIDGELGKLRPYAEAFRAWVDSGTTDTSRLLRGDALAQAERWAQEAKLSGEDRDFLAASRTQEREEEIAAKEKEAELEREKQAKEAAEDAQKTLVQANEEGKKRLQQRTLIGTVILGAALMGAVFFAVEAGKQVKTAEAAKKELTKAEAEAAKKLTEANLARDDAKAASQRAQQADRAAQKAAQELGVATDAKEELQQQAEQFKLEAQKARSQAKEAQRTKDKADKDFKTSSGGLRSIRLLLERAEELRPEGPVQKDAEKLRQGRLFFPSVNALERAGISTSIKDLELKRAWLRAAIAETYQKKKREAKDSINKSFDYLSKSNDQSDQLNQVKAFIYFTSGQINNNEQDQYKAYQALKESGFDPYKPKEGDLLSARDFELIHYQLIKSHRIGVNPEADSVTQSFRKYFLDRLELYLRQNEWEAADEKTYDFMRNMAQIRDQDGFHEKDFDNFPCSDLVIIDRLWKRYSGGHYGFSIQKKIWQDMNVGGNMNENLIKFFIHIGWGGQQNGRFSYWYMEGTPFAPDQAPRGKLPWAVTYYNGSTEARIRYLHKLKACENL